ncbi:MAG: hypothetical protein IKJ52_09645 [Muribaculaceae bacterium]|nr:hypothetical protein [Muribaculaceae bacterium]
MIMRKYLFLTVVAGLFLMTSCAKSKSETVIDEFENLVEEVESKKGKLTVDEWKVLEQDFNKRFEELGIDSIDEKEFSTFEKIELTALVVRWTAAMAESAPTLVDGVVEEMEKEQQKEKEHTANE